MNILAIERTFEILKKSHEMEEILEWDKWRVEIPYIKFPAHWHVKIIPPKNGAVIRFLVTTPEHVKKLGTDYEISVYLDCYCALGIYGSYKNPLPYWEIYPIGNDTYRCEMNDIDNLLENIEIALAKLLEKSE